MTGMLENSPYIRAFLLLGGGAIVAAALMTAISRTPSKDVPEWTTPPPPNDQVVSRRGTRIQLWAKSPLLFNPTSIDVDERGRVWVTTAVNYRDEHNHQSKSSNAKHESGGDRVLILEDRDGNGSAEISQEFVQDPDLVAPLGICVLPNCVIVSCSPSIFIYFDEDGDDRADRREVFLTGFGGADHDHGVHSVVTGPDGRYYFVAGNAGPHTVSDRNGWTMRSSSFQQSSQPSSPLYEPMPSDDGYTYVGGVAASIEPNATDLKVLGHNFRNPYEVCVDSMGDVWQTDNDDTAACRVTWVPEGANLGFASADGTRSWQRDQRPGQSIEVAHWHQDDPGVTPAGDVYGPGAPTGLMRYEGDIFGPEFRGLLVCCDAGRGEVFTQKPLRDGAGIKFQRERLVWTRATEQKEAANSTSVSWFRPSDIAIGPDGTIFIADWFDPQVGGHRVSDSQAEGRIYTLKPDVNSWSANSSHELATTRAENSDDLEHALSRLASPSPCTRYSGAAVLRRAGSDAIDDLVTLTNGPNPFVAARATWLLAIAGGKGLAIVENLLTSPDEQMRIVALRALRYTKALTHEHIQQLIDDESACVRRELATAMCDRKESRDLPLLIRLAEQFDGTDRWYLESIGAACEGRMDEVFPELASRFDSVSHDVWPDRYAQLVWRLRPIAAVPLLVERAADRRLSIDERGLAIDTLAFMPDPYGEVALQDVWNRSGAEVSNAADGDDLHVYLKWWIDELRARNPRTGSERVDVGTIHREVMPTQQTSSGGEPDPALDLVAAQSMKGDEQRGEQLFFSQQASCSKCHQYHGLGGKTGPDLSQVAKRLSQAQIVEAIIAPSQSILAGYETWTIVDIDGRIHDGLLMATGREVVLTGPDNKQTAIARDRVAEMFRNRKSLMPPPPPTFLPQDVADIAAFLTNVKLVEIN
ncbi:MAG: c-type cytochrome [Planctomycetales bacterium]|nr:c-type cytochrome [Planctomycetales bacterium]